MALLNLNTLLADHSIAVAPHLRAKISIAGTQNLTHIFSDPHLTLTLANPVEADGTGTFDLCYLMDGSYTVHLTSVTDQPMGEVGVRVSSDAGGAGYRHRFDGLPALNADTALSYGTEKGRVQVAAGDYVKANDTGQTYRVAAADDSTAPITTQGGVGFYINANRFDIKADAWGVKMSGDDADATNNAVAMQAAIDWLSQEGGGRITLAHEGHMKIDHAIRLRPGVTVDGAGTLTDNILTRQGGPIDKFGQDGTYLTGGFAKTDGDDHSWYPLNALASGADAATLTNAVDADQFEVGDIVWIIEANDTWGSSDPGQPAQSELARVMGKSGGVLELEHHNTLFFDIPAGAGTIGVNPTGAWIANVDWRVAADKTGGDWADTRFVLKDACLVHHRLMQSGQDGTYSTALFGARSGVYNCHVEDIEGMGLVANLMFGNGYAHSRYHNIRGPYIRRAIELKFLSQSSIFSDLQIWKYNHGFATGTDEDTPISIGEGSRCVIIDTPRLDVGNWLGDDPGLNLINFTGACDCEVRGAHVTGKAAFTSAIAFPNAVRCTVEGSTISVPTNVTIEDSGIDCIVRDTVFTGTVSNLGYRRSGTARGGRICGNTWNHEATARPLALEGSDDRTVYLSDNFGLLNIDNAEGRRIVASGNLNNAWENILHAGARTDDLLGDTTNSTTETPLGTVVTIPAGALQAGDIFEWCVGGECLGSGGQRSLSWRVAIDTDGDLAPLDGDDDTNVGGVLHLPATCSDWVLKAKAIMTHSTRIVTQFEVTDLTAGTTVGNVVRHVGTDFANATTLFTLSGLVADPSDTLIVRTIERKARRQGYLS